MRIVYSIKEMMGMARVRRHGGGSVGFVPTMGALHEGHLSLIRRSCKENDFTVVSIFVNPIQFGPHEDYKKYPRNLKQDAHICKKEGVDVLFCPGAKQMYPASYGTYISVQGLSDSLCGLTRRGHFKGVATVVSKLFHIVNPDIAYFGQKDAQQALIIKKMVEDLNSPIKIKVMPTVREKDGLAMSSRNKYLKRSERRDAIVLSQALNTARLSIRKGETRVSQVIRLMRSVIHKRQNAKIDYISVVDGQSLKPLESIEGNVLIALAVWIGKTRLIDNTIIDLKHG
jgi:pantoate--beta-alanine ligase